MILMLLCGLIAAGCNLRKKDCKDCNPTPLAPTEATKEVCGESRADASALAICPNGVAEGTGSGYAKFCDTVPVSQATARQRELQSKAESEANSEAKATAKCIETTPPTPTPTPQPPQPPPPPPTPVAPKCRAINPSIELGNDATFIVESGDGPFNWSLSDSAPSTGSGSVFATRPPRVGRWTAKVSGPGGTGECFVDVTVTPSPPPVDVCPNIAGTQETIPAGMIKDAAGNCVTPPPPPPPVPCEYTVLPKVVKVGNMTGSGSYSVLTNLPDCPWQATSNNAPRLTASVSGVGKGVIPFSVTANPDPALWRGTIRFAGTGFTETLTVEQDPGCSYTIVPTSTVDAVPAVGSFSVTVVGSNCGQWEARSASSWIGLKASSQPGPDVATISGTATGQVFYKAGTNVTGGQRKGDIQVTIPTQAAPLIHTVTQKGS